MSEISPEVWHELNEARKAMNDPTPETYDEAAENLTDLWGQHYNALIDAVRPKCKRCNGVPLNWYKHSHGASDEEKYCPDCTEHPGWAA